MSCPACGGALEPWRTVPAGEPSDARLYPLERCVSCGSAVTLGAAPGAELYESGQYALTEPRFARGVASFQALVTAQLARFVARAGLARGARVLDVGAGPGRLVAALASAGYDAHGIEPSGRSTTLAERAGLPVEQRGLDEHNATDLDAVVLWHVLEHLDDPRQALERVASWMRPGGVLMIGVPNLASRQSELAGEAWFHLDVPRHRTHFTTDGAHRLLRRSGFEVVRTHHLILEQNFQGMWMALLTRLGMTRGFPFHFLKRNIPVRPRDLALTVLGLPLLPIACALEALAAVGHRGGTIAVIACKQR